MSITEHVVSAARRAVQWHVHSQEVSRRNARSASTVLTQRRLEHREVEEFLAAHLRQRALPGGVADRAG